MNDENDAGTSLIPSKTGSGELTLRAPKYWTSLDLETDEGKRDFIRAKGEDGLDFDKVKGTTVAIRDILCHEAETANKETGEVTYWIRNVLILEDGTLVSGGSQGIRNSLADMIAVYGNPPWKPAIKVAVKERKTASKRKMHYLEII